jgi:hypothetical protein
MTLQGDQNNQKSRRTRIKTRQQTEIRHQNLLLQRLQKKRKMTNHPQVINLQKIKIKLRPKTLLRKIHQLKSQHEHLSQKMPKAFGRHLESQRQRLMLQLQRIRVGPRASHNQLNRKKIKIRIRKTKTRKALTRRGGQISPRQSPRLEMKRIKLQQTYLTSEFYQMDLQAMMMEMTVQPKRTMKERWRRMLSLLQLERERNQRSTSHSTMWMFLVSKLCGSSSRRDAARPGISRPSPG